MKFLKWLAIVVIGLVVIAFVGYKVMISQTKKHSPQETVVYNQDGYDVEIVYCRPFKKERDIFGGLVPYGEVWRTGANEATTFVTGTDLVIGDQTLPAGEYTLWTIPGPKKWEVIFNNGEYGWGVTFDGAARIAEYDVASITVPVQRNFKVLEQFTIEIDHDPPLLMLGWDFTRVDVPLGKSK